ncbi:Yip1-domain-containing protein [Lactarius akahatsu]|uniref:Protein YIP n=1 Tax=Lactarius akahatsu TaxID=416441 RepID=A0AAD4Q7R8_9AGAM|nr:Yip1-domain-containing protein [Lactarius akahatsu]
MAYVAVESDEHLEEGDNKAFTQPPAGKIGDPSPREGQGRGYISDASKASFWNVDYYQHHFDVDTKTVLLRCVNTLNPLSLTYTSAHLTPAPDLYGPFWTLTTLIFTLFITSSLAHSIVSYLSSDPVEYDFALLSTAVGLVYAYGIGVPVLLWGALRYAGISEGWTMVEAVTVWGYAMFVWIPVSILCIVPIALLRWILSGIAFGLSGYFLVANVYPVLVSADQKSIRLLIVVVAVLHGVVALLFKVLFFSYYIDGNIGPGDPTGINTR